MIELQDAGRAFDGVQAVRNVSFRLERGGFLALVGPSGCGKSTTLRMINRLVPHTSGRVLLDGRPVEDFPPATLRRGIGYVIQSGGLFPHWTVARNVATAPTLLAWPRARIDARVTELLDLLQLDAARVRNLHPHQLSGGQQQRVGVARALAADPDLLLMDEPFGALDPITRAALQDQLRHIHRDSGKTVVFVTHDMDEALLLATHIAVMEKGTVVQFGTPRELLQEGDSFARRFLGSGDIGLRRLSLDTVASRMRPPDPDLTGKPLDAAADLRHALSEMVARGKDRLAVVQDGKLVGTLHLADLVRA